MEPAYSVLVTGTRGKSSVVRLLAAAFRSLSIPCRARFTGVVPTEIAPGGARPILRSQGGHIEELRWWLRSLPDTEAVVAENSAISVELQPLAARWLRPRLIVITNARADHEESWGPGDGGARRALLAGIPEGLPLLLGEEASADEALLTGLRERGNPLLLLPGDSGGHDGANRRLALATLAFFGLPAEKARFEPFLADDPGRFRILRSPSGGLLAFAFSANEPASTEVLWKRTGWEAQRTSVLFNHRRDRPRRLRSFLPWLTAKDWEGAFLCGSHPWRPLPDLRWLPLTAGRELDGLAARAGRLFGCGNVAGLPLDGLEGFEEVRP